MADYEELIFFACAILSGVLLFGFLLLRDRARARMSAGISGISDEFIKVFAVGYGGAIGLILCFVVLVANSILLLMLVSVFLILNMLWTRCTVVSRQRMTAALLEEVARCVENQLSLPDYFVALAHENRHNSKACCEDVVQRLRRGEKLSQALFTADLIPMPVAAALQAAESSGGGQLVAVFKRQSRQLSDDASLYTSVFFWMVYPIALWSVFLPMGIFIIYFAFPRIEDIRKSFDIISWWPTYTNWVSVGLYGTAIVAFAWIFLTPVFNHQRFPAFVTRVFHPLYRRMILLLASTTPLLSSRHRHRSLSRTAFAMGDLASERVPLPRICELVATNELAGPYASNIKALGEAAERGEPFQRCLEVSKLPESFVALANAGAAGGAFIQAMAAIAEWHAAKARQVERLILGIVPCFTIPLCGLMVGSFYIGIFLAFLEITKKTIPFGFGSP
jgi:type II secretory pathway component PulF